MLCNKLANLSRLYSVFLNYKSVIKLLHYMCPQVIFHLVFRLCLALIQEVLERRGGLVVHTD